MSRTTVADVDVRSAPSWLCRTTPRAAGIRGWGVTPVDEPGSLNVALSACKRADAMTCGLRAGSALATLAPGGAMGKVIASITTSVDGYITGPDDGPTYGLGRGGERLHYWVMGGRTPTRVGTTSRTAPTRSSSR